MLKAGLLDEVMDRVDAGGLTLTGEGGFLPEMIKAVLERGLATELTEHLGYERGDPAGRGSPNSRNGTTPKTVATEVGDVPLECRGTGPGRSSRGWCPRARAIASPTRIPVTASSPIRVANVARRSGVRSELVAAISAVMSASEYKYGLARRGRCGSNSAAGTSWTGSSACR